MKTGPRRETTTDQALQAVERAVALTSTAKSPRKSAGSWGVLRKRDYSLLFWGQFISAAGTQMQVVTVSWQVYLLTHSAIALGLIGLFQAIPRLLFSLIGGVFADVFDRRKLLLVIELLLAATSAVLALATIYHVINMLIIYAHGAARGLCLLVRVPYAPGHHSFAGAARADVRRAFFEHGHDAT